MPKLMIIAGENSGMFYPIDQANLIIGRSTEVIISLQDPRASRKHAAISKIDNEFYLEDLQSQNGTFLNGQIIKQRCKLKDKDNIRVGNTWFTFSIEENIADTGNCFHGYQILEKILEDTTGKIFIAEQKSLQRNVLLWIMDVLGSSQEQSSTHNIFIENISKIAHLFHPNIMMLLDFAILEHLCLCSFEEVDFHSHVHNYVEKNAPISIEKILHLAIQAASALEYAHANNIFHLHLTSKNILILPQQQDRIVLTELGVSLFLNATGLLNTKNILGTWEYIAPEQIIPGSKIDQRTDIYAYGCFLYHLLTGMPPFSTDSPSGLSKSHLEDAPAPLLGKRADIPESFANLVHICLAKKIEERFSSFSEIKLELLNIQKKLAQKKATSTIPVSRTSITLKKWWFIFPILAILLGILGFFSLPLFSNFF